MQTQHQTRRDASITTTNGYAPASPRSMAGAALTYVGGASSLRKSSYTLSEPAIGYPTVKIHADDARGRHGHTARHESGQERNNAGESFVFLPPVTPAEIEHNNRERNETEEPFVFLPSDIPTEAEHTDQEQDNGGEEFIFLPPITSADLEHSETAHAHPPTLPHDPTHTPTRPPHATPLPSLLRYVDNILMRDTSTHDNPPSPTALCKICSNIHNASPIPSTFLPLVPCGCWIHYRCFIWWTTRDNLLRNTCPMCRTPLFRYEGITTLTLAARTGLEMQDCAFGGGDAYRDDETGVWVGSNSAEYVADCIYITKAIATHFHNDNTSSRFPDTSPDLCAIYHAVLRDLEHVGRPRSRWLGWSTQTGYLLFGLLVAVKMRRWIGEEQGCLVGSLGWGVWMSGWEGLQRRLLGLVSGGGDEGMRGLEGVVEEEEGEDEDEDGMDGGETFVFGDWDEVRGMR